MNDKHILGIDGGASKVFSQLYIFKDNYTIIDQSDTYECRYDEITGHNQSFSPVSLNVQKKEMKDSPAVNHTHSRPPAHAHRARATEDLRTRL